MKNHKEKCEKLGIKVNTKRYKRYYDAGLLDNLDEEYAKEVQQYWKEHYNRKADPVLHLALFNLTGKKDVRIVPGPEMAREFIPYFNDGNMSAGYKDKNIYDILIETPNAPKIVLKRVRGHYFNMKNQELSFKEAEKLIINSGYTQFIVKPSNTNNGVGIELLKIKEGMMILNDEAISLSGLEKIYGYNFMIQEVIKQHSIMKKLHPSSVNTLRMVTFRWNNKIEYLLTFARFGAENSVKDNAGAGGICVGVADDGEFLKFGVDEECNVHLKHPTTQISIEEMLPIPNFHKHIQFVKDLHKDILHMDLISWDIAIGENGESIFIEANFAGATWLYQLSTGQPMFGEMTEEVLSHVSENKKVKKDIGPRIKRLRKNNERLRHKNKFIVHDNDKKKRELREREEENKKLIKEIKMYKKQEHQLKELNNELEQKNDKFQNSTSWKITAPLRKVKEILK